MKKLILIGRSGAGKTTLTQALLGKNIAYDKTQTVKYLQDYIDTPGEYAQVAHLGHALAVYTYEADVVGLLCSSMEPYCIFPPCCTATTNRECIGIVTQIRRDGARPDRAESWLRLAGCKTVFRVDSVTGEGVADILDYLDDENQQKPN